MVVAAIRFTITSWLIRGLLRQLRVMNEKSGCSILFHLLVPGGRWQTDTLTSPSKRGLRIALRDGFDEIFQIGAQCGILIDYALASSSRTSDTLARAVVGIG